MTKQATLAYTQPARQVDLEMEVESTGFAGEDRDPMVYRPHAPTAMSHPLEGDPEWVRQDRYNGDHHAAR
ncbi:hypothetical protein BMS3Bbin04_01157 [bacterium BMS3Bbin04]|nr:hypothetical protein BMS3Bbin04_01157 [bacterium BMS3Bbin04]